MKVLHVIPSLSPVHGGPTGAIGLMERALSQQGVTVETATTDDDGPGRHNGKALGRPLPENGVAHWYFAKMLDFYKPSPAFARWIRREAGRFDLLHIHALFSFTAPAAAWAARRAGVPYVVRPLGTLETYGITQRRPRLKGLSMRIVEGPLLRNAAAVHFTSEKEAAQARQLGIPMREAIIPLGVETAACIGRPEQPVAPAAGAATSRLLYLSRLDPKKNVEGLLDAVALLKQEFPGLHLLIAGGGAPDYLAALQARAAAAGLGDRVSWAGHIGGVAKANAFAASDVFVLPSMSENFGIAAAEALAAGLPCVLGQGVAIAQDVASANAGMAVGIEPASIAQGLRRVLENRDSLALMSENARRLAQERFSMEAMGVRLKQLYTEILNP